LQCPVLDAKPIEERGQHLQYLGIHRGGFASGGRRTNDLCSNLIELAVASLLRTLAAKLRPDVVKLVQAALPKLVLDVGANDAGSVLRAQG
jgi:hypothetical protein